MIVFLAIILFFTTPLMAVEKTVYQTNTKTAHAPFYFATDVFSRLELITLFSEKVDSNPAYMAGMSFRFGRQKIYWYNQFRYSTLLPNYQHILIATDHRNYIYGNRLGFLTGLGGIVKQTKYISMYIDFGVGADFALDKAHDNYALHKYAINVELNWMTSMRISEKAQFLIGLNFGEVIFVDTNNYRGDISKLNGTTEFGLRTGLTLGFIF